MEEVALGRAKKEQKPIFLSIGYSACHWCRVMERESFENAEIAVFLNANFICIKVDREERPDLDDIYMGAVQRLTGSGGWPLSVWLTSDLKPFYGGTYFPPTSRYGRPGFPQVLTGLNAAWHDRRDEILTAWNGLAIDALAQAGRLLGDSRYTAAATEAAEFLLVHLRNKDGRWLRAWRQDRAQHAAVLEDHAYLCKAFLSLFLTTGESRWLAEAEDLADRMLADFWNHDNGLFFDTDGRDEHLLQRLLTLHALTQNEKWRQALSRAEYLDALPVFSTSAQLESRLGLFQQRPAIDGKPTLYYCEGQSCQTPRTDP